MQIIKLNATDSTNTYLKTLSFENTIADDTVVYAENQRQGKGQQGAVWVTEPGKNLTFSILKNFKTLQVANKVWVNCLVSLAIAEVLEGMAVPHIKVKWPNDIMSGNQKICGILIENVLQGQQLKKAIIGIGLNVNQTAFPNLPHASSLKLLLGETIPLMPLLLSLSKRISENLGDLDTYSWGQLQHSYEKKLYRKDVPSVFEDALGNRFMGMIRTINTNGDLQVDLEEGTRQSYALKEIKLLS